MTPQPQLPPTPGQGVAPRQGLAGTESPGAPRGPRYPGVSLFHRLLRILQRTGACEVTRASNAPPGKLPRRTVKPPQVHARTAVPPATVSGAHKHKMSAVTGAHRGETGRGVWGHLRERRCPGGDPRKQAGRLGGARGAPPGEGGLRRWLPGGSRKAGPLTGKTVPVTTRGSIPHTEPARVAVTGTCLRGTGGPPQAWRLRRPGSRRRVQRQHRVSRRPQVTTRCPAPTLLGGGEGTSPWILKDAAHWVSQICGAGGPSTLQGHPDHGHIGPLCPVRSRGDHGCSKPPPASGARRPAGTQAPQDTRAGQGGPGQEVSQCPLGPRISGSLTMSILRSARSAGFLIRLEGKTGEGGQLVATGTCERSHGGSAHPLSEARHGVRSATPCHKGTTPGERRARGTVRRWGPNLRPSSNCSYAANASPWSGRTARCQMRVFPSKQQHRP